MKTLFKRYVATFVAGIVMFAIGKLLFLLMNATVFSDMYVGDVFDVLIHGFSMDCTVAAYVAALPALLWCVALWVGSKGVIDTIARVYFGLVSAGLALCIGLDGALYGYWQFKLDVTPFSYFMSSPSSALASAQWWQILSGLADGLCLVGVFTKGMNGA